MNVTIIPSTEFNRQFKRLAKKYKSLLNDYLTLSKELKENPLQGDEARPQSSLPAWAVAC